ncbi:UTRA domain-containing protein [Micromonospora sp. Llam0]|uniref:UTRA domain-containing protein n=1 Tax=Micromonospora sp. Llam0 TaxID=2485143 RepID=UPI000F47F01B
MTDQGWTSSSDPYLVAQQHDAWSAEAAGRGRVGTQQLLGVETIDVDTQVRRALGLATGERAVVRRRLILEDNRPVELADSYYPEPIAAGTPLADNRKVKGGARPTRRVRRHAYRDQPLHRPHLPDANPARLTDPGRQRCRSSRWRRALGVDRGSIAVAGRRVGLVSRENENAV